MANFKANFDAPVEIDIAIPLAQEKGGFEVVKCKMTIKLVKSNETDVFKGAEEGDVDVIADFLKKFVVTPPNLCDEDDNPYPLETLINVPYIRNSMFRRVLDVSGDPSTAKGN